MTIIDILKEKLVINSLITREKCIYELSGMDFVINQNNINAEQKTSKLIDYMITGRPIFEFTQDSFDGNEFLKFLKFPKISYLNGGSYWKFGIIWLKYIIEFSHPKKNNKTYKKVTSKKLNIILNKIK